MKLKSLSALLLSATVASFVVAPVTQGFAQTPAPQTQAQDKGATPADKNAAASKAALAEKLSPQQQAAMKKLDVVSDEGYAAVRGIALARLAIFQGTPDRAKTILKAVKENIDKAQAGTPDLVQKLKQANSSQDEIAAVQSGQVPIDFSVGINDDYNVTPEKAKHVENANKHLGSGKTQEAIQELKLAEVNIFVTETDAKLPALAKVVETAMNDLDKKNYYEANLSLIKADDAISVRSLTENEPSTASTGKQPAKPAAPAAPAAPAPATKPAQ
ncbi:YfdX family protein [Brucella sp. IR073]|uniref:YfdX family protein n=1 Tax=unclassified Brucella TaxID=2632610 RepID=UPI003B987A01